MGEYELWVKIIMVGTHRQTDTQTDIHIDTMTWPGVGAKTSKNLNIMCHLSPVTCLALHNYFMGCVKSKRLYMDTNVKSLLFKSFLNPRGSHYSDGGEVGVGVGRPA